MPGIHPRESDPEKKRHSTLDMVRRYAAVTVADLQAVHEPGFAIGRMLSNRRNRIRSASDTAPESRNGTGAENPLRAFLQARDALTETAPFAPYSGKANMPLFSGFVQKEKGGS
jgi:hypothetical protein